MMMRNKGLTLIEITLSLAIIAVVVGFSMTIFSQGQYYVRKNRMHATALFLAQEQLEQITEDTTDLFDGPNPTTANNANCADGSSCWPNCLVGPDVCRAGVANFSDFEWDLDVTCPHSYTWEDPLDTWNTVTRDELAEVAVTVYWEGGKTKEQSVSLRSLVARFETPP